jgi:hypothetical protein
MKYEKLKLEIEEDIESLAKKIEQFCVLENKEYNQSYKDALREIHARFERL